VAAGVDPPDDAPHLGDALLCDRERLGQDPDVPQAGGNAVQPLLRLEHPFGHETVELLDPALDVATGEAVVGPT
jgi:hypothetical protein